jgi:tetratricopeptide (TPR) repeat protein
MPIDPTNPVVALCAAGMACEGEPGEARRLFEEAWATRRDDYDAAIAAHYLARHQPTPSLTLEWNTRAVTHCERIADGRSAELLSSLYLNLADSLLAVGRWRDADVIIERAADSLPALPSDGYRAFIALGIARLKEKLAKRSRTKVG